jgi:hypothetical protein
MPVYGQAPVADVLAAEAEDAELDRERQAAAEAGLRARRTYKPAPRWLLEQLLDGLRAMPTDEATYRGGWQ